MTGSNRAAALALAAAMVAGATGIGAGAPAARAGEAPGDGQSAQLPPVVVTATRVEQPVAEVGSAVTVISGEELRRRGIEFVADALDEVPGATVPRNGARGKTTSLFLRGANSDQTLVLIDGVRVIDPVGGGFDFGALKTDNIERIEVIHGPQSPLYGSDAIGGVVNIITRRGRGPASATVAGRAGNFHTFGVVGSVQGGIEQISGTLEASRLKTDNQRANDDFRVDTVSARLDARPIDPVSASVTFRRSDSENGVPGSIFFAPTPNDRQENELTAVGVDIEHRIVPIWTQRLSLRRTDQELNFTGSSESRSESVIESIEWVHTIAPFRSLSFVVGAEYRNEDGEFKDLAGVNIDADLITRALFGQAQLAPFGERLFLQAGARVDDGTRINGRVSPKVAGALRFPETGTRLHASWGRGIKGPTLLDLFFPGLASFFGFFPGNPDLDPERVTGWDVGVTQEAWGRRVEIDVTFFRNDFRDLVAVAETPPFPLVNVGRAHSFGVESVVTARPAAWVDASVAYTYLEAMNDDTQTQLLRRPRNQGSAKVTVRPVPSASATVSGLYVGNRRDFLASGAGQLGGYFRLDASATCRLPRVPGFRSFELLARVENILDRKYEEVAGFPALGTSFLAGVRGTF